MNNKLSKYKKSKIVVNLKKYSNVVLFSRREEDLLKRSKSSYKSLKTLIDQKNNNNKSKSINDNNTKNNKKLITPFDDLSTFAFKTISSFKNSFDSFSTKIIFPKHLMDKNQIDKDINTNFTISSFRSERKNSLKARLNKNKKHNYKKNIFCLTQNNFQDNSYMDNEHFLTLNYFSNKNSFCLKEKENEIKLLRQINFKKDTKKMNQKEEYLLNLKLNKMDSEKYNISLMLNRLREFKYYNYLNEQKKEINKTSLENSKNNIDFLTDKINTLNNMQFIYNNKISNKLGEYSKFISNYKEREKIISDLLLNQINSIKKEVKNLQNKIAKKELESATILKWVYFLIKMKEKKLILPQYYKKIVETNFERKKEKRKTIVHTLENIKSIKEKHKSFFSHHDKIHKKDSSDKQLSRVTFSIFTNENFENDNKNNNTNNINKKTINKQKSKNSKKKSLTKSTISFKKNSLQINVLKANEILAANNIFNFEDNNAEVDKKLKTTFNKLIQDGISVSEINRISKYKLFLIYKTPEDLEDRLIELQNENVQLLRQYEIARKKLSAKQIKFQEMLEIFFADDYYDLTNKIKEREIELNHIKKKNELLKKQYTEAKANLKLKNNFINIKQRKIRGLNKEPITQDSVRKELFSKIERLYELCLQNTENPNSNKLLKDKTKKDVIHMMTVIEFFIVKLKSKLNFNDKSNMAKYDLMRRIKNEIEHKHKIEKGQILRLKEKEKFKYFQDEIEEKMNKILFLTKRRIIPVYNLENMNKEKRFIQERKLNFEDFMFE